MHFNNMHGNKNIGRRRCYKNLMRLSAQQQHLSSFEPMQTESLQRAIIKTVLFAEFYLLCVIVPIAAVHTRFNYIRTKTGN
jgi:hypothetical protein